MTVDYDAGYSDGLIDNKKENWILFKELIEELNLLDKDETQLHNKQFAIDKRRIKVRLKLSELVGCKI